MEIIKQNIYEERMRRIKEFGSIADLSFEAGATWGMEHANDATKPLKGPNDKKVIYLIGSLRNKEIPNIANQLRDLKFEVFDDWHSVSPNGDDLWKEYEIKRGRTYEEALKGWHAHNVFDFDKKHVDDSDIGVLIMPAGKSAFLELGYIIGQGKSGFILMDDQERYDVMVLFTEVTGGSVCFSIEALKEKLKILL